MRHVNRLRHIWKLEVEPRPYRLVLPGLATQRTHRTVERNLRIAVIAFRRWTKRLGLPRQSAADRLGLSTRTLAYWEQVASLFSPPCTPGYNGACEAGIGSLKTHAHHHAARHGRPREGACDDVETARLLRSEE